MAQEELPRWQVALINAVVAAVFSGGSAGASLFAGPPGAITGAALGAGAGPILSRSVQDFLERVQRRRLEQAMQAVDVGSSTAQLPTDDMLSRLEATPARQELLMEAMQAAAHATFEEKVKAIGAMLARGALADEAMVVDHERLFVRAMTDFDLHHLQVLEFLSQQPAPTAVRTDQLASSLGLGDVVHPVLAALERHGAIERMLRYGEWVATDFGRECLRRVKAAEGPAEA